MRLFFTLFFLLVGSKSLLAKDYSVSKVGDDDELNYKISATKLDNSRNELSAKTGQSSYSFDQDDINNLPQGHMTPVNQVLLRAPGVTQNSLGQIHVRGDHSNVQYRINDVMIPQGISGFNQSFDTHFASSIDLLRGALPAQYGYRTGGVVDIKTKGGKFEKNNRSEVIVGSNNTAGVNQQVSGFKDNLTYYLSASYLRNDRGIESPTSANTSIHNESSQDRMFGYFSRLIDDKKRLSLILANSNDRFQIPNVPGAEVEYSLPGGFVDSNNLNQNQQDENRYAILSLQGVSDLDVDYQVSLFSSQSKNQFRRDLNGDLIYSGVASNTDRQTFTNGLQADFKYDLNEKNILRSGLFFSDERLKSDKNSAAFVLNSSGDATTTVRDISDRNRQKTRLYGIYLQDELKATEKLTLNLGLRFDAFEGNVSENQFSPRFGATYDLTNKTKIYGGYARYFSPAKSDLLSNASLAGYSNTSAAPEVNLNNQVRPERSNYFDIGVVHKFNKNLTVNLDSYYKQTKNLLDEHQFGHSLIYSPFNYAKGKSYGVEFGADYKKGNFSSFANFSMQKTRAKNINSAQYIAHEEDIEAASGKYIHLDHDQRFSASFGANYLYNKITYGFDGFYGSGLRTNDGNANTMPSYVQVNTSISRDFKLPMIDKTNFKFTIINLFDNVYQLHDGNGVGVQASQYGSRRTGYLIISKNF